VALHLPVGADVARQLASDVPGAWRAAKRSSLLPIDPFTLVQTLLNCILSLVPGGVLPIVV
jgi:hypothetical protein